MSKKQRSLPDFTDPPVNETVFSLQFLPLAGFAIPHFGLYWAKVRARFPHINVAPPVAPVTEQFSPRPPIGLDLQVVPQPEVRCWFLNSSGTQLIQVQRDRFSFNWRQVEGTEKYPRFPALRKEFVDQWIEFSAFIEEERLGALTVNQCEVTYVNHIPYGIGWSDFSELHKVIAMWQGETSDGFLPRPERVRIEVNYRLPENQGRLHVSVVPVFRPRDNAEVLQMTLTARGGPASSSLNDVMAWIDLGREWVVKGFADFTSPEVQSQWGRSK